MKYIQILVGTYTRPTQQCYFQWPCVTLGDLAKYSLTRSVARSLCNSWGSCSLRYVDLTIFKTVDVRHLEFYGCNNGFFEKPMKSSSIQTTTLNCCLVFEKITFLYAFWRQTNKQTNRRTALMRKSGLAVASGYLIKSDKRLRVSRDQDIFPGYIPRTCSPDTSPPGQFSLLITYML